MKPLGPMHLGLLAIVLVNMLPAIEAEQSWGIFAIAVASAVLSCAHCRWRPSRPVSRWLIYGGVLAASFYLVYELFFPHEAATVHLIDLAHFLILLGCCKFFELHTSRDAGLTAVIAFLLLVISAFISASPLFALALATDLTFGVGWIMAFHNNRMQNAVEARRRAALAGMPSLADPVPTDTPTRPPPGYVRTAAACSTVLVIVAALLFIATPRGWGIGLFARMQALVPTAVTGISDLVRLTNERITEDDSPVMKVRFYRDGQLIRDESFEPYMRGLTFDCYDRGRWRRKLTVSPRQVTPGSIDAPAPLFDGVEAFATNGALRQDIWLDSVGPGVLFSLYPPLAFGSPDLKRNVVVDRRDLVLRAGTAAGKKAHYTILSPAEVTPGLVDRLFYRAGPPRDGISNIPRRVKVFARSFVADLGDPTDPRQRASIAAGIRDYLASSEFKYTFNRGAVMDPDEPIEDFLFENKKGHCEYFASAMTLMCQAVGIRARMVNGYHGGEYNPAGGFYLFRQRDAHAWVEVYLAGRGWIRFDPTPPAAVAHRARDATVFGRAKRFLDSLQFKWSTLIVSFGADNRAKLVAAFEAWAAKLTQTDDRPRSLSEIATALFWGPEVLDVWQRTLYWLLLILCAVFVVLAIRVLWILSLMLREYFPDRAHIRAAAVRRSEAKFYDRLLLLLACKGHVKPVHDTPREFARSLARTHTDLADLPALIEWFYEAQYGQRPLGPGRWERIRTFLNRLREDPAFGSA
ncbi:MAG: DUF3488 and DUF4129 domain-containing transglutaminase family protein [Phycisphaerae bacterium]